MADTDMVFMDENFSFGTPTTDMVETRRKSKDHRYGGSVKSTKSLYFTDPDASGTMARDEEVTLNIYDIYSDGAPSATQSGGKINRSDVTSSSFKSTNSDVQINTNGRVSHTKGKAPAPPPPKSKKQGAFQMKTAADDQNKMSRASSAGSLHDEQFKMALSNTLTRKMQSSKSSVNSVSEASVVTMTAGQDSSPEKVSSVSRTTATTTPSLASTGHVQTSQAVPGRPAINGLSNGPLPGLDGGNGNDTSPGASLKTSGHAITTTHKTTKVTQSQRHTGDDVSVTSGWSNSQQGIRNEAFKQNNSPGYHSNQASDITRNSSSGDMIIHETTTIKGLQGKHEEISNKHDIELDNPKNRPKTGGPGKFQMRYKEGPELGKVSKLEGHQVAGLSSDTTRLISTNEDVVSASSTTSTLKSAVRDENFKASISELIAGGKTPNVTASAPSSLGRQKKSKFQAIDISIEEKSPRGPHKEESMATDDDFESSTFPRDNKKDTGGVIASTPTSPYDELKETVKGGTVGTLVKDLFRNLPLTGRAIDPSTLERKRTQASVGKTPDTDPDEKKFKFLVEGIDTPDRPDDADQIAANLQQEGIRSKPPLGLPMLGSLPPIPFTESGSHETPPNTPESMEVSTGLDHQSMESINSSELQGAAHNHTEEVSSLKRMEKKGFSYINRNIAQDVMRKAGVFTARKPHESIEENARKKEAEKKPNRESLIFAEAKAKLQKKESIDTSVKDVNGPVSPEVKLMAAKSKLLKQDGGSEYSAQNKKEIKSQSSLIESSMLKNAKSRLRSTKQGVDYRESSSVTASHENNAESNIAKHEEKSTNVIQNQAIKQHHLETKSVITRETTTKLAYEAKDTKKSESKSDVKNVSALYSGNVDRRNSGGVVDEINIHTPTVVGGTKALQASHVVNKGRAATEVSSSTEYKSRQPVVANRVDQQSNISKDGQVQSTIKVTDQVSHAVTVGSGSASPDFHSPKSIDPPDSAYYSDSKVSPNFEFKNGYKQITEETVVTPRTQQESEDRVGYAMTETPRNKTDISQNSINRSQFEKSQASTSIIATGVQTNSSADKERYDRTEPSLKSTANTPVSKMSRKHEQSSYTVIDTASDKAAIRSLREVKKAAQRMTVVDIEYDLKEPLRVSQRDLRTISLSQSSDKNDGFIPNTETKNRGEDENNSILTKRDVNTGRDPEIAIESDHDAHRSTSSSSSEIDVPTPTMEHGNIYIDIPIRDISSSEVRAEKVSRNRIENRRGEMRPRTDSGSGVSFNSSTDHYRRHNRRDVPANTHTHFNGPSYPMYSPGASSTQTENTYSSVSVPMVSPSISRTSSLSTTAQDTFEYSKSYRNNHHQRHGRRTIERNPLQPLTININSAEHRHRERVTGRPTGGRSRSETRVAHAHHTDYHATAAPVMDNEQGMFRMSQMSGREMTTTRHGQRQHSPRHREVRATYEQPLSHGPILSPGRDPYRMRPREESFNSQSSGPLSPPGRYLRIDENRGGRVPIYGRRGRSIKDLEMHEYSHHTSHDRRIESHVSRVHVDDAYDYGDANSALSEPVHGTAHGKYSVHRVMEKGGLRSGQPMHPDMQQQQQSRKRRVYQVTGTTMNTGTRTLNGVSTSSNVRSSDVQAVDPDLLDADKKGDRYNITLKLNAMGSRPGSRHDDRYEEQMNSLNNNTASRYESQYDNEQTTYNHRERTQRSHSHGQYDRDMSPTDSTLRQMTLVKLKDPSVSDDTMQGQYSTNARFKVRHDAPQVMIHGKSLNTEREYVVKSMTGTDQRHITSSDVPSLNSPNRGSEAPRFTMTVNQTMTMDYVAPTDEEADEEPIQPARRAGPERPPRRKKSNKHPDEDVDYFRNVTVEDAFEWDRSSRQTPVDEGALRPTRAPNNEERRPRKGRRKMSDGHDDLEYYLSPAEEQENDQYAGEMPQVVRGSILIKNSIDTTGAPKVIDVVEGDDSDDEVIVEDNVNMFHGAYFQSRENPMYSSDPDLSGAKRKTKTKRHVEPSFTNIFHDNEKYRDIKVNRDPGKRHRVTERTQRTEYMNGHDEPDRGGRSKMSKEQRTEYEISRLLKDAPKGSIKQSINVEREEEDILGPMPVHNADGTHARPEDMLNFDTVSEKVDMGLRDGKAEVAVKVRCERIVPIRGVEDMFKKSSVIVTRLIEIDLFATEERRELWESIKRRSNQGAVTDGSERRHYAGRDVKLSTKDTFNLYKTFMGLAEADESGKQREHMRIDRKVEEERRPELYAGPDGKMMDDELDSADFDTEELDRKLEETLVNNHKSKKLESDTMSFVSAASETHDMLY